MDLTVRLFSTARVRELELSGGSARVRLCDRCAAKVLGAAVKVRASADGQHLSVDGRAVTRVFVDGEVKASTGDGRVAQVAGRWVVGIGRDGLQVSVQVPSERYVMAVLQAEAASDEPLESLKALAVVARSFAMHNPQRHGAEGLCDSTHSQALRFGPVPARVREAVESTAGETLWFRGSSSSSARQVSGYFTEDCGGVTEDAASLWGGEKKPWLVSHPDPYCVRKPALWHAELRLEQVREALAAEGLAVPAVVSGLQVLKSDASGRVTELEIGGEEKNGPGLKPRCSAAGIQGPEGPCSLRSAEPDSPGHRSSTSRLATSAFVKAATLRFALDRAYGWNQLRSDWYRVSVAGERVVFDGRGFGHGVGLCQAGARAMAEQGKSYREVLRFYFPGTDVRVLAGDAGWGTRQANGWRLRAVRDGNELVGAGDAAWAKAQAVFPGIQRVQPVVTVYPTTELFREGTGEPGWELGASRGVMVAVQAESVVARASINPADDAMKLRHERGTRGSADPSGMEDLLLHEFLHVLVERDAGAVAPLWLREGLVEVLAGGRCVGSSADLKYRSLSTPLRFGRDHKVEGVRSGRDDKLSGQAGDGLDAALAGAGSLAEAQRAHAAACARVGGLVQRYGMTAVRGWLRGGVPAGVVAGQ